MSFSSPSAPTPPDPVATANAQAAMNADTARTSARLNRLDQIGPEGTIRYTQQMPDENFYRDQLPKDRAAWEAQGIEWDEAKARKWHEDQARDRYTVETTLSPTNQRLYDLTKQAQLGYGEAANKQIQQASGALSTPFSGQPYMDLQGGAIAGTAAAARGALDAAGRPLNTDYNAIRQQSIEAANSRLMPQFRQQEEQLRARLMNSGITEGSEAWNRAYRQLNEAQNDSRQQTLLNAEGLTGQAIAQTGQLRQIPLTEYGMAANLSSNFGNQATQGLQNALTVRAQPLNEAAALLTGQQVGVPQMQQVPGVNVAPTDYLGAVNANYAGQMNAYNQQMNSRNAAFGGAASLLGTLGGAALRYGMTGGRSPLEDGHPPCWQDRGGLTHLRLPLQVGWPDCHGCHGAGCRQGETRGSRAHRRRLPWR